MTSRPTRAPLPEAFVVEEERGPGWLDIDGAAQYLNLPRRMILRLVEERRCRHFKAGRYVRFRREDLDEWARSNCREARP